MTESAAPSEPALQSGAAPKLVAATRLYLLVVAGVLIAQLPFVPAVLLAVFLTTYFTALPLIEFSLRQAGRILVEGGVLAGAVAIAFHSPVRIELRDIFPQGTIYPSEQLLLSELVEYGNFALDFGVDPSAAIDLPRKKMTLPEVVTALGSSGFDSRTPAVCGSGGPVYLGPAWVRNRDQVPFRGTVQTATFGGDAMHRRSIGNLHVEAQELVSINRLAGDRGVDRIDIAAIASDFRAVDLTVVPGRRGLLAFWGGDASGSLRVLTLDYFKLNPERPADAIEHDLRFADYSSAAAAFADDAIGEQAWVVESGTGRLLRVGFDGASPTVIYQGDESQKLATLPYLNVPRYMLPEAGEGFTFYSMASPLSFFDYYRRVLPTTEVCTVAVDPTFTEVTGFRSFEIGGTR